MSFYQQYRHKTRFKIILIHIVLRHSECKYGLKVLAEHCATWSSSAPTHLILRIVKYKEARSGKITKQNF